MTAMQLNPRTKRYEGFTDDGHFVTVIESRWTKEGRRSRKEGAGQLLDPTYWLRREVDYVPEVMVWSPCSFMAVEARIGAGQGQLLYTVQPPQALVDKLIPQVFVRPTPLGYGIQLVFPGMASILRGHIQDATALFSILYAHGIGSLEQWEIARTHVGGIPMPAYRIFREEFPLGVISRVARTISAALCASLVPDDPSDQQDGAAAEEQRAKDYVRRFKGVALEIGEQFIREQAASLKGWKGSVYPPQTEPEGNDLARMIEAVLWQRFYEKWSGYAPDEAWCVSLGDYLCNLLFQLVYPEAFVPLTLPLHEEGESGKDEEL